MVLGLLCGIAAWALIRSMLVTSALFKKMPGNDYTRHAVGMLSIGILMYVLLLTGGNYYVDGVGYGVIQEILRGTMTSLPLLVILFFAKLYATSVSIGSGASGGVFSPSLFVGATLGAVVGIVGNMIFPEAGITPVEFALVGMGGVVAAGTGAAMTAIIMIFEMTRDYNIIVPLVVAVAIALGFRRMIISETIYTSKLVLRGRHIPKERHSNMFMVHPVREIMTSDQIYIDASLRVSEGHKALKEVIKEDFVVVVDDMNMYDVIKRMERRKARAAVVVRPCRGVPRQDDIRGVITKSHIADSVVSSMQHYIG